MQVLTVVLGAVAAVLALSVASYFWPRPTTVMEHERALKFRKGHLLGEVGPGRYWLRPRIDELQPVDARRRQVIIAGQEVLTSDRIPLKVSLVAEYTVGDVTRALTEVESYQDALYTWVQLALREAVSDRELDAALEARGQLGQAIQTAVGDRAAKIGLQLQSVQVRDFMMAGGLRQAYADVVQARQEGLAALERARGESASVRNLANAAQLMERHPGIMQLRLLQAVEQGSENRVVIALDPERAKSASLDVTAESD